MIDNNGIDKADIQDLEEPKIIMTFHVSYLHLDEKEREISKGLAEIEVYDEGILLYPPFDQPIRVDFKEMMHVIEEDYKLHLTLGCKEKIIIFDLGYDYEDFVRLVSKLRNKKLLKDLLMEEGNLKLQVAGEYSHYGRDAQLIREDECDINLYETGVVLIPKRNELRRIHYSLISRIEEGDYVISLFLESGERYILAGMGREFDLFKKTLSLVMQALFRRVQATLKDLFPQVAPRDLRLLGLLIKEGKAVKKTEVEAISPSLWQQLEGKLEGESISFQYNFLKALGQEKKISIGIKRGLMGSLTGEYIWFLVPIYSTDPTRPGNAVAMEVITNDQGGKATYFFRMVSRSKYSTIHDMEHLDFYAETFIKNLNYCMIDINFRREPIYLAEDKLKEPRYSNYAFALEHIPSLRELRYHFIGRIRHHSEEQWQRDVLDLLNFNIRARTDDERWSKGK